MRIIKTLFPLSLFILLCLFLWRGLSMDPRKIPSVLLNKPAPTFSLPTLKSNTPFSKDDFTGHISIVNVWATWCYACRDDHPVLMDIARIHRVKIFGLDYKDNRQAALDWLDHLGDPYDKVGFDSTGDVAINWGVYGTPETFLVDQHGIIRYKLLGSMTPEIWRDKFLPIITQLEKSEKPS